MDWWDLLWGALYLGAIILVSVISAATWHLIRVAHRDERPWRHDPDEAARYRAEMRTEWNTDWQRAGGGAVPGEPPTGASIGRSASNLVISQEYLAGRRRHATGEPMWPRP